MLTGASFSDALKELFKELCLKVYNELEKKERMEGLPPVDMALDSIGTGWSYPGWVTNLTDLSKDGATLPLLTGVLRETLSMIIRGDITNCKEGVFKFLLEALWETISRNEPLGPSRYNDMYDVYAEIRRHEDKSLSIILSDIGLRYTFQKFVPNETYEYNIAPDDTLWTRTYYVGTAGAVSKETILRYINECQGK